MNNMNFGEVATAPGSSTAPIGAPRTAEGGRLLPLLAQYFAIVRRRRWLILSIVAAALAISLIFTILSTPQFTARTTIEISREGSNIVRVEGVEPETSLGDMEFYQTQYGLLQSRSLAERVATDLRLFDDPDFFAMYGLSQADEWFENGRLRQGASTRDERVRKAGDLLLANVGLSPVRLSRLVHLDFTSPDAEFSARVANAWAERFIRTTLERRFEATAYARQFLEQRLQQLRTRLDESERQLVGYAAREGIVNLPLTVGTTTTERSIIADDLGTLNRELSQATADRMRAQSRLTAPTGAVTEALQNQAITGLRQRRAQSAAEYSRLMVQFEPNYPPVLALRQEIEQLDGAIAREEARVRQTLQADVQAAQSRERRLADRVSQLKGNLLDQRRRSIQYNIFQREVDTNSQLYDALLQRYKEIGVAGGVGVNNIAVVDAARSPEVPSSPRLLFNIVLALAFGIATGIGAAMLLEQIDDAISDPSDLVDALGIAILGAVPKSKGENPYLSLEDRKSDLSESYLAVQTSLSFSTDHGAPTSLAVTSTRPGEGKSTTAYAIALSLVRIGRKVILIDGDMRSPSVHHHTGVSNAIGLSNFLSGDDRLENMVLANTQTGISVLPAGPQPPSAAELLSSERLSLLLAQLGSSFDHIVIDCPPVMGLADAPLISSHAEGTIFVVESHNTKLSQARVAVGRLAAAQAHLVGAVLTKFEAKKTTYGYGYEYGYGYGHNNKPSEASS